MDQREPNEHAGLGIKVHMPRTLPPAGYPGSVGEIKGLVGTALELFDSKLTIS